MNKKDERKYVLGGIGGIVYVVCVLLFGTDHSRWLPWYVFCFIFFLVLGLAFIGVETYEQQQPHKKIGE